MDILEEIMNTRLVLFNQHHRDTLAEFVIHPETSAYIRHILREHECFNFKTNRHVITGVDIKPDIYTKQNRITGVDDVGNVLFTIELPDLKELINK